MATPSDAARKPAASSSVPSGLVFDLEGIAVPGRRVLFEVCQKLLKEQSVSLSPVLFARFLLNGDRAKGLARLGAFAGGKSFPADTLAEKIQAQFLRELAKPAVSLDPALKALLADTAKQGLRAGALSFLPGEAAEALVDRLGLKECVTVQVMDRPEAGGPTADCWLAACKRIGAHVRRCVALVRDAVACGSSLEAGMYCIAVPDDFSGHQDFGGADLVAASLADVRAKDIQALLKACTFR